MEVCHVKHKNIAWKERCYIHNSALLKKLSDSKKPQYIKYPLSFLHKIWYNTHIADDPKIGAFYQKTANLRGA